MNVVKVLWDCCWHCHDYFVCRPKNAHEEPCVTCQAPPPVADVKP